MGPRSILLLLLLERHRRFAAEHRLSAPEADLMAAPASGDDLPPSRGLQEGAAPSDEWEIVPTTPEADRTSQQANDTDAAAEPATPSDRLSQQEEDNRRIREPQEALTTADGGTFAPDEDATPRSLEFTDTARSAPESPSAADGAATAVDDAEELPEEYTPHQGDDTEREAPLSSERQAQV